MRISFEDAVKGAKKSVNLSQLNIPNLVEINIPAGADAGMQLRLEGVIPGGPQSPAGDLLVTLVVDPSPTFRREDFDLYVDVPIDMADAALGTSVNVPTVDGTAEVTIKPGTQPNDKLRMRGYGVMMDVVGERGRRGDQYVRVLVRVPTNLTSRQKELLEELRGGKRSGSSSGSGSSNGTGGGSGTSSSNNPAGTSGSGMHSSGAGSGKRADTGSAKRADTGSTSKPDSGSNGSKDTDSGSSEKKSWKSWFS